MIRFLLFCFFFIPAAAYAENNAAFTDYQTITDAAFPASRLSLAHRRPGAAEARLIENARSTVLELINIERVTWFSTIAKPPAGTADDWYRIEQALSKTPVWVCQNGCTLCPMGESQGCIVTKRLGQFTPSVIFLNPCMFGVPGCKGGLLNMLKKNLAKAAYFAVQGPGGREQAEKVVAVANQALEESASMMDRLVSSCPGPFPSSGEAFLRRARHIRPLNEFASACAKNYLEPFLRIQNSPACKVILDFSRLEQSLPKALLTTGPEVFRCDSFCEKLTCGSLSNPLPRVIIFGSQAYVSLPEGACSGAVPGALSTFVEEVIRHAVLREASSKPGFDVLFRACLKSLVPTQ